MGLSIFCPSCPFQQFLVHPCHCTPLRFGAGRIRSRPLLLQTPTVTQVHPCPHHPCAPSLAGAPSQSAWGVQQSLSAHSCTGDNAECPWCSPDLYCWHLCALSNKSFLPGCLLSRKRIAPSSQLSIPLFVQKVGLFKDFGSYL